MSATTTPVPPIWTTGSTEAIRTGTWRAALPRHVQAPSPCHQACPVNGDIAEWIGLARARDFQGSWQVLARHNPFPSIAGRSWPPGCRPGTDHTPMLSIDRCPRRVDRN